MCLRCPQVVTDIREVNEFQRALTEIAPIKLVANSPGESDADHNGLSSSPLHDLGHGGSTPRE